MAPFDLALKLFDFREDELWLRNLVVAAADVARPSRSI
jgi:hypothetical protein